MRVSGIILFFVGFVESKLVIRIIFNVSHIGLGSLTGHLEVVNPDGSQIVPFFCVLGVERNNLSLWNQLVGSTTDHIVSAPKDSGRLQVRKPELNHMSGHFAKESVFSDALARGFQLEIVAIVIVIEILSEEFHDSLVKERVGFSVSEEERLCVSVSRQLEVLFNVKQWNSIGIKNNDLFVRTEQVGQQLHIPSLEVVLVTEDDCFGDVHKREVKSWGLGKLSSLRKSHHWVCSNLNKFLNRVQAQVIVVENL
ncbi:hypothetical protein OGAPHI_005448 [Ogataea philodendri]|uniref:Uncharacterized protein n=1 Tax=Ogataea philodendri TaxID=1378263 RepID=A0A9P8NZ72_9ASCO|nr:uncharacterized protein OGAPHI_005448 [Ogataea philodendri]KAH3662200.1 hypothetical protein OGAPHI_005448 [Ogataea philodendri]